jgi:hypothetical protein
VILGSATKLGQLIILWQQHQRRSIVDAITQTLIAECLVAGWTTFHDELTLMRHNRTYDPGNKDGAVDKNTKSASYHAHHRQWFSSTGLRRPVDLIQRDYSKYQRCNSRYRSEAE